MGHITRRQVMGGTLGAIVLGRSGVSFAALPESPIEFNIMDAAGSMVMFQRPLENYAAAFSQHVSRLNISRAPEPEVASKIQAQQRANRVGIDLVLTGVPGMSSGLELDLWEQLLPAQAGALPDLAALHNELAAPLQTLAQDRAIVAAASAQGPILACAPSIANRPGNVQDLLEWARQNPNKYMYSRMANSGPARQFMQSLPYILKDSDPKDPVNGWSKTWEYLTELDKYVEYYPGSTGASLKEFADGTREIVQYSIGFDINGRALGVVPVETEVAYLEGAHWILDGVFACIPKGLSEERLALAVDFLRFLHEPEQQGYIFDNGYFYPGPTVKGVTLDMAPQDSQEALAKFGRPKHDEMLKLTPSELPLPAKDLLVAIRMWDEKIGSAKSQD